MVNEVTLLVDHREHPEMKRLMKELIVSLAPKSSDKIDLDKLGDTEVGDDVKFLQLEISDYSAPEYGFAIERKSDDFIPEVRNGNLFAKLSELSQYPHAFLIIDKSHQQMFEDIKQRAFQNRKLSNNDKYKFIKSQTAALNGAISSCCLRGFPPIFCGDKKTAAELIVRMYYKAKEGKSTTIINAVRPKATHKDRAMNILVNYPFIGELTAEKLLKHYGSVEEVNIGLKKLFAKPNKSLMRELGLNKKNLEQSVAVLIGSIQSD
jgi:ERCC4-type nuclease